MKKSLCLALALALLLSACGQTQSGGSEISVYYLRRAAFRTDGELLRAEALSLPAGADAVTAAAEALARTPSDVTLQSPLPEGVTIADAVLADGVVTVTLSDGYLDAADVDRSILKSCLALTFCSVPDVSAVSLRVGSETVDAALTAEDVLLTNTVVSANKAQLRLYFPRAGEDTLGCEYRTITTDEENSAERRILEAILAGPEDGALARAFPEGTRVKSVYTQDGVCTVTLAGLSPDETGRTKTDGRLAVYAVVDSLTALAGVKSVQIVLDGQQSSTLWGFDISRPLSRGGDLS